MGVINTRTYWYARRISCFVLMLSPPLNCPGAGMGVVFGLFLGAMGDMQPLQMVNGRQVPQAPFKEQVNRLASMLPVQYGWCRLFRLL